MFGFGSGFFELAARNLEIRSNVGLDAVDDGFVGIGVGGLVVLRVSCFVGIGVDSMGFGADMELRRDLRTSLVSVVGLGGSGVGLRISRSFFWAQIDLSVIRSLLKMGSKIGKN